MQFKLSESHGHGPRRREALPPSEHSGAGREHEGGANPPIFFPFFSCVFPFPLLPQSSGRAQDEGTGGMQKLAVSLPVCREWQGVGKQQRHGQHLKKKNNTIFGPQFQRFLLVDLGTFQNFCMKPNLNKIVHKLQAQ